MLTLKEKERYSRHLLMPEIGEQGQEKLKAARVLIIGAGGLGCPAALYLAAAGIGTLGIADMDRVEESNLQRQILFTQEDIGQLKSVCAARRLVALNPLIKVISHPVLITNKNALDIFSDYDIILDGSDNFFTRYLVNDACVLLGKPLVYGSIHRFSGQVSIFNVPLNKEKRGPTYRCLFPDPPSPGSVGNCSELGVLGSLPGLIGTMQASEVIKYLTGIGELLNGKLFLFDMLTMKSETLEFDRCADWGSSFPENKEAFIQKNYELVCGDLPSNDKIPCISVQELQELLKDRKGLQLIDVREPMEQPSVSGWADLSIPLNEITAHIPLIAEDKIVILFCKGGVRSEQAIRKVLKQKNMKNLYSLKGGIMAWLNGEKQLI